MPERNENEQLIKQAEQKAACLIEKLKTVSQKLVLAESCTGGLISSLLAEVPGASVVLWGSFVCYTKEAK
ncbi:CinA family protein, partial [Treponema sp. R6D11]